MELINCKDVREQILTEAKLEVEKIYADTGQRLKLVVIQVEGDAASDVYIRNKIKTCDECGVDCVHVILDNDVNADTVRDVINIYACDENVHGIMLQLPLPSHLKPYQQKLLDMIPIFKDVDGLSTMSSGRLLKQQSCLVPCTAQGCIHILENL